jgi:coenzyme F420 hydrogenase subunit beta
MEAKYDFSFNDVEKMNIRDDISLYFNNKEPIHVNFDDMKEFARPACFSCPDFSNIYADISFGGLGSEQGYTTSLIRTTAGESIFQGALKEGYIKEPVEQNTAIKKSEMLAKVMGFSQLKKQKAELTLKEKE